MRESCLGCFLKHIAQAIVLIGEGEMGYPEHRVLACGHLAEAADETIKDFPALAIATRDERVKYFESIKELLLAEAELEALQADNSANAEQIREADDKVTAKSNLYIPDLMSLIKLAIQTIKDVHKDQTPMQTVATPQPSEKINKYSL